MLLLKELYKLTSQERDIIMTWRIIHTRTLSLEEIQKYLPYTSIQIQEAIKIFNHNCRLRLETEEINRRLRKLLTNLYDFDEHLQK
jgi:hypothetical protein